MNLAAVLMSLEMALVWKLWLGITKVRGHGTARLLRLSSFSGFNTAAQQLRSAPDKEGGGDKLCTGAHFQGMTGCGRRAVSRAEKTRELLF